MRILGHIHTFNEASVIDRSLRALLGQTYPVEEVLLVDNASTDGTLDRPFPATVKVIRFEENMMTSAPIIAAMNYAMEHGYDWVWILNGDSAPRRDSLEKLMTLYSGFSQDLKERTWLLAALPVDVTTSRRDDGFLVTPRGLRPARPARNGDHYECDTAIWSGSLYRVPAVRDVGLPRADYAMDMAEIEYGYRGRCRGYRSFVHQGSVIDHNIRGPSLELSTYRLGPLTWSMIELKPFRCSYIVRNVVYFWLYDYKSPQLLTYIYCFGKIGKLTSSFALRPFTHWKQVGACFRGLGDGLLKRMDRQYKP